VEIREIRSQDTLEIRLEVLRPNGSLEDCMFPGDDDITTKHFGSFIDNNLVGIVSFYKVGHSGFQGVGFQIRAMATISKARGKSVGVNLLNKAEECAVKSDADYVWANARTSAKEFYRKSGYHIDENEFNIKGIRPHVVVSKTNV